MRNSAFRKGWKPVGRPDVLMRTSRDQRMLYDSGRDRIHILNETAEFVWNLCDGEHTVEDMARRLRETFEVPAGIDVVEDVERVLATMLKKNLLAGEDQGADA